MIWTAETISTHTPLTGRDDVNSEYPFVMHISTHTPLTGRDGEKMNDFITLDISTHTPLTGRDIILAG